MLKTKEEFKPFLSEAREGLTKDHVVSEFVQDHWAEIATETYIATKARNLAALLGGNFTPAEEHILEGVVYATGNHIQEEQEKAEGWVIAASVWDRLTEGTQIELKRESLWTVGFGANPNHQGKVVRMEGNRIGILPKGKRTRGFVLAAYEKIRFI